MVHRLRGRKAIGLSLAQQQGPQMQRAFLPQQHPRQVLRAAASSCLPAWAGSPWTWKTSPLIPLHAAARSLTRKASCPSLPSALALAGLAQCTLPTHRPARASAVPRLCRPLPCAHRTSRLPSPRLPACALCPTCSAPSQRWSQAPSACSKPLAAPTNPHGTHSRAGPIVRGQGGVGALSGA